MKNAMKKLLSLVLVAMLLVSVVPMGAMAAEDETVKIGFVVNVNGKQAYPAEGMLPVEMTQKPGTMLSDLIDSMDAYGEFDSFAGTNGTFGDYEVAKNYAVVSGETYTLNFTKSEEGKPTDPPATEKKDVTLIVKVDGEDNKVSTFKLDGESAPLSDLLYYHYAKDWKNNYNFVRANRAGETFTDLSTKIYAGDEVSVRLEKKNTESKPTEPSVAPVHYVIKLDSSNNILAEGDKTPANGKYLVVKDLLSNWSSNWDGNYDFSHAQIKDSDKNIGLDGTVEAGKTVYIMLKSEGGSGSGSTSDKVQVIFYGYNDEKLMTVTVVKGKRVSHDDVVVAMNRLPNGSDAFTGWKANDKGDLLSNTEVSDKTIQENIGFYAQKKSSGNKPGTQVLLNIYTNGKLDLPAKTVTLTGKTILSDGYLNLDEVETVVDDYYKNTKENKGFELDGLYVTKGNSVVNWATDSNKKTTWKISDVVDMFDSETIAFNVYAPHVTARTSSNADSSNPKTGDDIYMTVTVMGLSAAALCAVYFVSKKRAVR